MEKHTQLTQNILLAQMNTHARNIRIHESVEYLAAQRVIVHRCRIAKRRLWGLLPVKATESVTQVASVPDEVTTVEQLRKIVKEKMPYAAVF